MMEELMIQLQPLIVNAAVTILTTIGVWLGAEVKKFLVEKANTEEKRRIIETTCRYVNQLYHDLSGPEKLQKAKDAILQQLDEKGISITELEMDVMIEATVNGFKEGFNKTESNLLG